MQHTQSMNLILEGSKSTRSKSILELFDSYPLIRAVFVAFPPLVNDDVKGALVAYTQDMYWERRLDVLEMALNNTETVSIMREWGGAPTSLLQHPLAFLLIESMLNDPMRYRFALGFLFTQLSMHQLPQALHAKLVPLATASRPLTLVPEYSSWALCSLAESRLQTSVEKQAVLLVNGSILLKFKGKLSGLALKTMVISNGTLIVAGCWYAPIDERECIRQAFDAGESQIAVEGRWTFLGAYNGCEEEVSSTLEQLQSFVKTLPDRLSNTIDDQSRQSYRYSAHEEL